MRTSILLSSLAVVLAVSCAERSDPPPPASGPSSRIAATPREDAPKTAKSEAPAVVEVPKEPFTGGARAFDDAKQAILARYYDQGLTEDDVWRAAVAGMLEHLDPRMKKWNTLISPARLAEMKNDLKGEIVGVGVTIHFDAASGHADVLSVIPNSPAERAGILAGDRIVNVDGRTFKGLTDHDISSAIRGKAGETVKVTVLREDKLIPFAIVRAVVQIEPVSHGMLADGVGYVRIMSFSQKALASTKAALADLATKNVRALVVDLRENQGGGFDDAIGTAELFVPAGGTIASVTKRGGKDESYVSKSAPALPSADVVAIVDHETASGAELLADVLRESRKAPIVGARTFGKWSVQTVDDLGNGYAIKFTVGLFHGPSGASFDGVGLVPDVEVDAEPEPKMAWDVEPAKRLAVDPQLRTALALVTRRLPNDSRKDDSGERSPCLQTRRAAMFRRIAMIGFVLSLAGCVHAGRPQHPTQDSRNFQLDRWLRRGERPDGRTLHLTQS